MIMKLYLVTFHETPRYFAHSYYSNLFTSFADVIRSILESYKYDFTEQECQKVQNLKEPENDEPLVLKFIKPDGRGIRIEITLLIRDGESDLNSIFTHSFHEILKHVFDEEKRVEEENKSYNNDWR